MKELKRRQELREAIGLALVPVGVAFVFGVLLLPRRAPPENVPLPIADRGALAATIAADHELAESARREPLPGPVRALGSAIRSFHTAEAKDAESVELYESRKVVDEALRVAQATGPGPLLELRAVELEQFLGELDHFEDSGEQSPELLAVAGGFVRSLGPEGWSQGRTLVPDRVTLRVMFKQMWTSFLHLEGGPGFDPTLDEERVLYAFYLSHPHMPRGVREAVAAARRGARDARSCAAIDENERAAIEAWRLERIAKLALLDPAYPASYARGVASYRKGDFRGSARAFREWLTSHPDGPLTLRAQNFLRAAVSAEGLD